MDGEACRRATLLRFFEEEPKFGEWDANGFAPEADVLAALKAVPGISAADLETISKAPFRGWDPEILKEPNVYRTYEAITHYGNAIKLLINEKFGDGIMSAIDFYMTVGGTVGKMGEKRVVITFNGKFLPFIEQVAADNSAASPEIAE